MKNKIIEKINNSSIGTRLIVLFSLITLFTSGINLYMYWNIAEATETMDKVFVYNSNLNELSSTLDNVQQYMYDYLNTKSSDTLINYYDNHDNYRNLINELNDAITSNNADLMERKIHNMSLEYLEVSNSSIQAKRGRNIKNYNEYYDTASDLYSYLKVSIDTLNFEQFVSNSNTYYSKLESLENLQMMNLIIILILVTISLFFIIIMTQNITRPLKELASQADEVAKGNFNIKFDEILYDDEIGTVSKAFKKMIISIQKYIKQIKSNLEKEAKLKENELLMTNHLKDAQLKYLHAQINPHFLFNTLNAGVQLALMEDAGQTSLFIEKTAQFFRYNINKLNVDATLEEEIGLVDNYIYIMSIRLFDEISYKKKIDNSLLDVRVPSMILQPIVENALNYGIRDIDWQGKIELRIFQKDDKMCISIHDNGKGISKEKIYDILHSEPKEVDLRTSSNGIGLKNVIKRLDLYFESNNLLEIYSEGKGQGTEIRITLPYNKQNNMGVSEE